MWRAETAHLHVQEWTYNRLLDSMLRDRGFEARVTIMQIRLVPEGVHVLKHIPFVAHYSEETVLQVPIR